MKTGAFCVLFNGLHSGNLLKTRCSAKLRGVTVETRYQLFGRSGSGSFAVQVALEEAGARYESIHVGREPSDADAFRRINPTGKVPALRLPDGTLMFESAAILIHLAATHPQARLAPVTGSSAHARFLQWMVFLSANLYEATLRVSYPHRYSARGESDAGAILEQADLDFYAHLELISKVLDPYVMGAQFSVADIYLYMLATWCHGDRAVMYARRPLIAQHAALVGARPAIINVEAEHAA
jgi:glutathione S-transferase